MNPTERFTDRAEAYAAGRPSYPPAALDALLGGLGDPAEVVVADLGAGTGIGARLLAERGARVFAVEPNAAMRAAAAPNSLVRWIDGTAEATGLEEASVDLVVAFQAFHWFRPEDALREMLRVVRPAGRAAVVYNERNEDDPFTGAYGEIVRRHQTGGNERRRAAGLEAFESFPGWRVVRRVVVDNEQVMDRAGVVRRASSTSNLPQSGLAAEALRRELDALIDAHAAGGRVTMRLRTILDIADVGSG
ncbi:MAG: class I SAM-dependent methyltransferase [Vulcanimicrobiaceae bacterium]